MRLDGARKPRCAVVDVDTPQPREKSGGVNHGLARAGPDAVQSAIEHAEEIVDAGVRRFQRIGDAGREHEGAVALLQHALIVEGGKRDRPLPAGFVLENEVAVSDPGAGECLQRFGQSRERRRGQHRAGRREHQRVRLARFRIQKTDQFAARKRRRPV